MIVRKCAPSHIILSTYCCICRKILTQACEVRNQVEKKSYGSRETGPRVRNDSGKRRRKNQNEVRNEVVSDSAKPL